MSDLKHTVLDRPGKDSVTLQWGYTQPTTVLTCEGEHWFTVPKCVPATPHELRDGIVIHLCDLVEEAEERGLRRGRSEGRGEIKAEIRRAGELFRSILGLDHQLDHQEEYA